MKTYGILGQSGWFAFGTWAGAVFYILLGAMHKQEIKSWADTESGLELLLYGYVAFALLLAVPHAAWLRIRAGRWKPLTKAPWVVSLVLGLIYLPLLSRLVPLLIFATGQGQGNLIGSSIMACLFGFPVIFAEVSLRLARRYNAQKLPQEISP